MKTIQEMVQKATGATGTLLTLSLVGIKEIEAFAALVREDERNRAQRENAYVQAEREACLDLAKNFAHNNTDLHDAIRARGQA